MEQKHKTSSKRVQSRSVSDSDFCPQGGKIEIEGDVNDSQGTGRLNLNYADCTVDGLTINGIASLLIHSIFPGNSEPNSYTLKYSDLTIDAENEKLKTAGNLKVDITIDNL